MDNISQIIGELSGIAEKVSQKDRMDAAIQLGVSIMTVNRYLSGAVKKEAFGLDLLGFLKARIKEREKALA